MNKREKELIKTQLKNEKKMISKLKKYYNNSLNIVKERIKHLQERTNTNNVYRIKYQELLKNQIEIALKGLSNNVQSMVTSYVRNEYIDGVIGTAYNLDGLGYNPSIIPVDIGKIEKTIQKTPDDYLFSERLYKNMEQLKRVVKDEISRGFITGDSYEEIARNITNRGKINYHNAIRIARTEGHRANNQAKYESMLKQKEAGMNIKKRWSSTLDNRTRETHNKLEGQTKDIEEYFEVDGLKTLYPGGFWIAKEDINCRCTMLIIADKHTDIKMSKYDNENKNIMSAKDYKEYKKIYLQEERNDEVKSEVKSNNKNEAQKLVVEGKSKNIKIITKQQNKVRVKNKNLEIKLKELASNIIMTKTEIDALERYTCFDATIINGSIRRNKLNSEILDKIYILDEIMDKSLKINEDMLVYRGAIIQNFLGFENRTKITECEILNLKGNIIKDRAFVSTSINKGEMRGRNINMKIKIKKGYGKYIYIEDFATPKYQYQKELLLKRGTNFYVNHVELRGNIYYMEVEVVDE